MGAIFLIDENDELKKMNETMYEAEELLQSLLEKYPELMPGDQLNTSNPRRWLLISRETGVPDSENSNSRWSLDHLFLDQEGVPTLVEVKRSTDTRIRREVVGQMLDYAANATVYWRTNEIRELFERRCEEKGVRPESELEDFLGSEDSDELWKKVELNLAAGRIRMIFVADKLPKELRRIIEFLNQQMSPAEVLGLEIKQYTKGQMKSLIPQFVGLSEEAHQKKMGVERGVTWDEGAFLAFLNEHSSKEDVDVAKALLAWSKERLDDIWWGKGKKYPSFVPTMKTPDGDFFIIYPWSGFTGNPKVEISFQHMKVKPFGDLKWRKKLIEKINEVPGLHIEEDRISKRPGIPFETLKNAESMRGFLKALDWAVDSVKEEYGLASK